MPSLADYARLAPFSIDELVDAANSVLRHRPSRELSRRTVRYYVSEGVLTPPLGSPKFARYGMEHLLSLVAARCLQDLGHSLETTRDELPGILSQGPAAVGLVQSLVDGANPQTWASVEPPVLASSALPEADFAKAQFMMVPNLNRRRSRSSLGTSAQRVLRLPLGPNAVLEVADSRHLKRTLRECQAELDEIVKNLDDSA